MSTIVVVAVIVVAGIALRSHFSNDGSLTDSNVRAAVNAVETAKKDWNIDHATSYLSDDCHVQNGTHTCREVFVSELNPNAKAAGAQLGVTAPEISIENGKAHAKFTETKTVAAFDKQWVRTNHLDETLEVRNGRVVITGIVGRSSTTADGHAVE